MYYYNSELENIRVAKANCVALHEMGDLTRPVDSEIFVHEEEPESKILWGEFRVGVSFMNVAFDAEQVRDLTEDEMLRYLLRPRNALMSLIEKYPETAVLLAVPEFHEILNKLDPECPAFEQKQRYALLEDGKAMMRKVLNR